MKPFNSHGQSFTEIPVGAPKRSTFNKSYTHKSSGRIGKIQPIHCKEVLASSRYSLTPEALLRFEPMAVPMLSSVHQRIHNYQIPFRQLWNNFETFITRGKDQTEDLEVPHISLGEIESNIYSHFYRFAEGFLGDIDSDTMRNLYMRFMQEVCGFETSTGASLNYHTPWSRCKDTQGMVVNKTLSTAVSAFNSEEYSTVGNIQTSFEFMYNETLFRVYLSNFVENGAGNTNGQQARGNILCHMLAVNFVIYMYYFGAREWNFTGYDSFFEWLPNTYTEDIISYELRDKIISLQKEINGLLIPLTGGVGSNASDVVLQNIIARTYYDSLFEPFIGTSSVWSYLGYPVITRDEWLLGHTFVSKVANEDAVPVTYEYTPAFILQVENYYDDIESMFRDSAADKGIDPDTNSLFDFHDLSVLPLRAFYRVWWYNYRDQRIEHECLDPDTASFKADNGGQNTAAFRNTFTCMLPRYIAWAKDTFTTATLNSYSSNIIVPLGDDVNVETIPVQVNSVDDNGDITSESVDMALPKSCLAQGSDVPREGLTGLSLSLLRKCQAIASWLDKNMFIGYQYADQLYSHYGVKYSDARLQIPEYIGGTSEVVAIDVITNNTNTASADGELVDVAGRQSARMQGFASAHTKSYFSEEHGLSLSLMSILPESSYPDSVDRSLLMKSTFDIAFPEFAQTGSDIVATGEVAYSPFIHNVNVEPFGYQGRYYHYKSNIDRISGNLRTDRKEFTYARFFLNPKFEDLNIVGHRSYGEENNSYLSYEKDYYERPYLTSEFIHCLAPTYMFVSQFDDQFICDMRINLTEQLPLPVYDEVL